VARLNRIVIGVALGLLGASVAALVYCTAMPGRSFQGRAKPLDAPEQIVENELRGHVKALAVDIGPRLGTLNDTLARAERYLQQQLQPLTRRPGVTLRREALENAAGNAANLVLDAAGSRAGPVVLIGAHYDSAPGGTPAANDNGSGVAAALVLAQRLTRKPHALPLRIVLFANEEMPHFVEGTMGSQRHARGCKARGEKLRAMFSLETMGYYSDAPGSQKYPAPLSSFYPNRGNFIGFVGNLASRGLVRESLGSFRAHASIASEGAALPADLPGVGWSDHRSFWEQGYSAVMVTDTALFRDPNYHQLTDTPDKLDFERLTRVVLGLEATFLDLAGG
jgi:hypothetical protein